MISIIDYGAGNLRSVAKAFEKLGYPVRVTSEPADILSAPAIVLPGVGAAADAMRHLEDRRLVGPIRRVIADGRPFFGVCLGLQLLFTATEEGGWHECLGILPGRVRRLPAGLKVPHMGWNQVRQRISHPLFDGVPDGANFYFVHSYYGDPDDPAAIAGETEYSVTFASAVIRDNVVATQFHPEKSGDLGLRMYDNFVKLALGTGKRA